MSNCLHTSIPSVFIFGAAVILLFDFLSLPLICCLVAQTNYRLQRRRWYSFYLVFVCVCHHDTMWSWRRQLQRELPQRPLPGVYVVDSNVLRPNIKMGMIQERRQEAGKRPFTSCRWPDLAFWFVCDSIAGRPLVSVCFSLHYFLSFSMKQIWQLQPERPPNAHTHISYIFLRAKGRTELVAESSAHLEGAGSSKGCACDQM